MYEAILFYGIRRTIDESFIVDEMLLKEYGLGLSYDNEIITVNERLTILLPCVGRSEVHSLNPIGKTGWDDRFHRYAKAVGMGDYSIGWHVHLPKTKGLDARSITTYVQNEVNRSLVGVLPGTAEFGCGAVLGVILQTMSNLEQQGMIQPYSKGWPIHGEDVIAFVDENDRRLYYYRFFFTVSGETERSEGLVSFDSRFWDNRVEVKTNNPCHVDQHTIKNPQTGPLDYSAFSSNPFGVCFQEADPGKKIDAKPGASFKDITYEKDRTGKTTGRLVSSRSSSEKKPYTKPTIITLPADASEEEQQEIIDKFFAEEEVGGKVVVREGVTVNHRWVAENLLGLPISQRLAESLEGDTLHSTLFGDLIEHGDGTWTVKYWRRGGSKLAAPQKIVIESDRHGKPFVKLGMTYYRFKNSGELTHKGLTNFLNALFSHYREIRRQGGPKTDGQRKLCEIIVDDDLRSGAGDGETRTYKFDNGVVQRRAGDRWFVMSWTQHGFELIRPLEIRVGANGRLSFIAGCGEFSAASSYKSPQHVVADLADVLFRRYEKLLDQRGDDSEHAARNRKFLSSKIRSVGKPIIKDNFSGDEVEPTWVFADKEGGGGIQQRAGDRWFVTGWKTDDLELIKPIEVQLHASIMGLTAGYEDYSGPTRTCPKVAVRDFVKWMFRYYEELGKLPVNEMSSQDVTDFDFLDKVIQQKSVEGEVAELREDLNEVSEKISESLKKPYRLTTNQTVTEASEEDLVAQAKAYLEKPLKE